MPTKIHADDFAGTGMSLVLAKRAIAAGGYYPAFKRARTAASFARMAYNNRRTMYRAARKIGRSWRRYAAKKHFRPPQFASGTSTAKKHKFSAQPQTYNDITLNGLVNLTRIPHTSGNDINGRQRNLLNIRGFKFCCEVVNISTLPIYFNMALIIPKGTNTVGTVDFFRSFSTDRGQDFDTANCSGLEFGCLPINLDKYFVLFHKRMRLNKAEGAVGVFDEHSGRNYANLDFYKKFNRQVRYDAISNDTPESSAPMWVHWAAKVGTGNAVVAGQTYSMAHHIITYFREPK